MTFLHSEIDEDRLRWSFDFSFSQFAVFLTCYFLSWRIIWNSWIWFPTFLDFEYCSYFFAPLAEGRYSFVAQSPRSVVLTVNIHVVREAYQHGILLLGRLASSLMMLFCSSTPPPFFCILSLTMSLKWCLMLLTTLRTVRNQSASFAGIGMKRFAAIIGLRETEWKMMPLSVRTSENWFRRYRNQGFPE